MSTVTEKFTQFHEVRDAARALFDKTPDWVTMYREILGVEGLVRKTYMTKADLMAFYQSDVYAEIVGMLHTLRTDGPSVSEEEPTRVITVRLPKSMKDALDIEAHENNSSLNQLCISKLLKALEPIVKRPTAARPVTAATAR